MYLFSHKRTLVIDDWIIGCIVMLITTHFDALTCMLTTRPVIELKMSHIETSEAGKHHISPLCDSHLHRVRFGSGARLSWKNCTAADYDGL